MKILIEDKGPPERSLTLKELVTRVQIQNIPVSFKWGGRKDALADYRYLVLPGTRPSDQPGMLVYIVRIVCGGDEVKNDFKIMDEEFFNKRSTRSVITVPLPKKLTLWFDEDAADREEENYRLGA